MAQKSQFDWNKEKMEIFYKLMASVTKGRPQGAEPPAREDKAGREADQDRQLPPAGEGVRRSRSH